MPRPIVGIGHSFGGNQLINLSLFHPRLFTTLILLDPVIQRQGIHRHDKPSIAQISTFRRDLWPSRAAAAASFNKSPFYKRWDKRVLDRWLQYGLQELPTPVYPEISSQSNTTDIPVTLKTTKHQEVWTFFRPAYDLKDYNSINRKTHPDIPLDQFEPNLNHPFYRPEVTTTFHKLPFVRPSVLYILGETSDMSLPELRKDKLENTGIGYGGNGGMKEGRVKEVVLKDVGHLVPMEDVEGTAEHTAEWLGVELKRWREDEREWEEARKRRDPRHDIVVNDEWLRRMGQGMTVKPKM
jgi:pimeloyl-ACP methyl ester carboxylesterase